MINEDSNDQLTLQLKNFQIDKLRDKVSTGKTRPEGWRRIQLKRIRSIIDNNEEQILKALNEDLQKPYTEGIFEIISVRDGSIPFLNFPDRTSPLNFNKTLLKLFFNIKLYYNIIFYHQVEI